MQVLDLGHCMIGERGVSDIANTLVDMLSKKGSKSHLRWLFLSNNNACAIGPSVGYVGIICSLPYFC